MKKTFSVEEKLTYLRELLESGMSQAAMSRKIGVSEMTIHLWLKQYGFPDTLKIQAFMKEAHIPSTVEELQAELAKLRKEKSRLEKDLKKEKDRSLVFDTLIDLAERTYHIQVRKNSDAK